MKFIRTALISSITLLLLLSTLIFFLTGSVIGQEVPPAIEVGSDGVLFAIGVKDGDRSEFQEFDWEGIKYYECTVGVNCESRNFPARLLRMSVVDSWDYLGVAQVTINFNLNQSFERLFLRIVRTGSETTIVKLDDSVSHYVTHKMLESRSWNHYGDYDLDLGSLDAGIHNVKLTIDERGMGEGRHKWDAIIFFVK